MKDYIKCTMLAGIWGLFHSMYLMSESGTIGISDIVMQCSLSANGVIPFYLIEITLGMMPFFIFQIVFGTIIYRHFCIASVYYFSRCNARIQWFLREMLKVFMFSVLHSVLIPVIVIGITAVHSSIHFDKEGIILFIYLVFIQSLWLFFITMMMNLISIRIGSQNGFMITSAVQLTFIILLGIWDKLLPLKNIDLDQIARNGFWLKWNPISHLIFNWHTSNNAAIDRYIHNFEFSFEFYESILVFSSFSIVIIVIGCVIIKYHDLIVSNIETE